METGENQATKRQIDWSAIERDFCAGVLTLRAIAAQHGITHAAIAKRADKEGWTRDATARLRARAAEIVVSKTKVNKSPVSKRKYVATRKLVENYAEIQADAIIGQREDIRQARALALSLMNELQAQTDQRDLADELCAALRDTGEEADEQDRAAITSKRLEVFNRIISFSSRVSNMKSLAEILKTLIALECEALGIVDRQHNGGNHQANVQVNISVNPQEAYMKLINGE